MKEEMQTIRQEYTRLSRIITPLMGITDLTLASKRIASTGDYSTGLVNVQKMSEDDKMRELEHMNPVLVLNNLANFVNI